MVIKEYWRVCFYFLSFLFSFSFFSLFPTSHTFAVRSSVFKGMFASDMREGREGVVTVEETDPVIFQEMLRFIYTGR